MQVTIEGFKSIRRLSVDLGDLTVLVGPPAGGKTNIMEALATLGYAVKVLVETRLGEFPDDNLIPYYNELVRALSCEDLIWRLSSEDGVSRVSIYLLWWEIGVCCWSVVMNLPRS